MSSLVLTHLSQDIMNVSLSQDCCVSLYMVDRLFWKEVFKYFARFLYNFFQAWNTQLDILHCLNAYSNTEANQERTIKVKLQLFCLDCTGSYSS